MLLVGLSTTTCWVQPEVPGVWRRCRRGRGESLMANRSRFSFSLIFLFLCFIYILSLLIRKKHNEDNVFNFPLLLTGTISILIV